MKATSIYLFSFQTYITDFQYFIFIKKEDAVFINVILVSVVLLNQIKPHKFVVLRVHSKATTQKRDTAFGDKLRHPNSY